jgi:ABC-type nitrate/sulfonate/bicarbonate transport system substrate-binding protein
MIKFFIAAIMAVFSTITFAKQEIKFGVNYTYSYMPLGWALEQEFPKVAKEMGIPNTTVKMVHFPNSGVGFDLMLNNQLDVIVASPNLVNNYELKDPGKVRFLIPMNLYNSALRCKGYKTIEDIRKKPPVVAVPGRLLSNHQTLQWVGETYLGDNNFFDDRMVVLKTQQLMQVVQSGSKSIDCIVWGSPVQNQLTDEHGFNIIAETDLKKNFPGFINMVVVKKPWADANPKVAAALIESIKRVNKKWLENPKPYLQMYMEKSSITADPDKMMKWYKESQMFGGNNTVPSGLDRNLRHAHKIGFIKELAYKNLNELFWKPELLDKEK